MKSIFKGRKHKTFMEKMKDFDKNHKVPNWISVIIVGVTIVLVIKFVLWLIAKNG